MIEYKQFELENGLKIFVHEDKSSPLVAVNILYNVGSRDENIEKTGFAHLFEHLMFGGSANIRSYDTPLQKVGGQNNAFTSPDITNYYITLPAQNIETAFWLESDRMMSLSFDPKVLEIQQKVVIEEFKQRYLNQPYGDAWLKLRPLAYKTHPYQWATIGKEISHIENATLDDVKAFFHRHYLPNNAIMVVGGNATLSQVQKLSEKWFAPIAKGILPVRNLPKELPQLAKRTQKTTAKVPLNAIYKAWHIAARMDENYYAIDLLSDILGRGQSSRLYQTLVKEKKIFNSINAYVTGSIDEGLFVVEGKLNDAFTFEQAENEINLSIDELLTDLTAEETQKVKNQAESSLVLSEIELLNKVMNLAFSVNLGDADLINKESGLIQKVTADQIINSGKTYLSEQKSSVLYYSRN
ncbi:MAG: M16 family metallopeptidase [Cytophagales bacterium]